MSNERRPPFPPQDIEPPGLESRMDPKPRYQAEDYRPGGFEDYLLVAPGIRSTTWSPAGTPPAPTTWTRSRLGHR